MSTSSRKILILCVDRDADLTKKAGIKGPVIGREACVKAGVKLLTVDPEEADANAIFGAVREYDRAIQQYGDAEVQVATITGDPRSENYADAEVERQLTEITSEFKADLAILVSDGADDEKVLPLLHSFFPRVFVRRIIVQQSRELEETYFLLKRYLKKLLESPGTRAYVFGVPGAVILITSVLSIFNLQKYMWSTLGGFLGILLMERGFSLKKRFSRIRDAFGRGLGRMTFWIGLIGLGYTFFREYLLISELVAEMDFLRLIGKIFIDSSSYIMLCVIVMVLGGIVEAWFSKKRRELHQRIFSMATIISLWVIFYALGLYLIGEYGMLAFILSTLVSFSFSGIVLSLLSGISRLGRTLSKR
ncbi:MAG: hypothetical protein DRO05_01005 [Thermoproteota archaeon]|nr:MAG: hypothetical protein DRO05_01005 [Candidatus Korarchaeota archaeon]